MSSSCFLRQQELGDQKGLAGCWNKPVGSSRSARPLRLPRIVDQVFAASRSAWPSARVARALSTRPCHRRCPSARFRRSENRKNNVDKWQRSVNSVDKLKARDAPSGAPPSKRRSAVGNVIRSRRDCASNWFISCNRLRAWRQAMFSATAAEMLEFLPMVNLFSWTATEDHGPPSRRGTAPQRR
jgi:hypothetical protein